MQRRHRRPHKSCGRPEVRQYDALGLVHLRRPCDDGSSAPCYRGAPSGERPADQFLSSIVPQIMNSAAYKQSGLILITFAQAPQTGSDADSTSCCENPTTYPNVPAETTPTSTTPTSTTPTTTTPTHNHADHDDTGQHDHHQTTTTSTTGTTTTPYDLPVPPRPARPPARPTPARPPRRRPRRRRRRQPPRRRPRRPRRRPPPPRPHRHDDDRPRPPTTGTRLRHALHDHDALPRPHPARSRPAGRSGCWRSPSTSLPAPATTSIASTTSRCSARSSSCSASSASATRPPDSCRCSGPASTATTRRPEIDSATGGTPPDRWSPRAAGAVAVADPRGHIP